MADRPEKEVTEVPPDQLQSAVEGMHNCPARLVQSVPIVEQFNGLPVWEGIVHVFDLEGHPKANRAYAWSSPVEGSDRRKFFAVLHVSPVLSPLDAVKAAILADSKK